MAETGDKVEGIQIVFGFKHGATSEEIASKLRAHADKLAQSESVEVVDEGVETEVEETPPPTSKKKKAQQEESFDEPEAEVEEEVVEEEVEEEEVKKPVKAKALTQKDVEAVCKAHARKHGFETTKALLAKKFKTSSIGKIDPKNYAAVVAAVKI